MCNQITWGSFQAGIWGHILPKFPVLQGSREPPSSLGFQSVSRGLSLRHPDRSLSCLKSLALHGGALPVSQARGECP